MPKGVVNCGNCVEPTISEPTISGKTFNQFDTDSDGNITEAEINNGLREADMNAAWWASYLMRDTMKNNVPINLLNKPEFAEAAEDFNASRHAEAHLLSS